MMIGNYKTLQMVVCALGLTTLVGCTCASKPAAESDDNKTTETAEAPAAAPATAKPMTRAEFWRVIDAARQGAADADEIAERVEAELATRSAADIRAFEEHRVRLMEASYTLELRGAGHLINGGSDDEDFDLFRSWLISQGQTFFDAAVANPDSLSTRLSEDADAECEDLILAAGEAYNKATGKPLEAVSFQYPKLSEPWDFEDSDEMKRRYPGLWRKFGW